MHAFVWPEGACFLVDGRHPGKEGAEGQASHAEGTSEQNGQGSGGDQTAGPETTHKEPSQASRRCRMRGAKEAMPEVRQGAQEGLRN